jgi:hypothetical protein
VKHAVVAFLVILSACLLQSPHKMFAQEASSGLDLRTTLTGQAMASTELTDAPRSGSPLTGGFRGVGYPAWKMSDHWAATAALQLVTRPYYYEAFETQGYGAKGYVLQASLNYARVSSKGSLEFRIGQLSSAFGSYLLRYDDADNALIDLPLEYGYYYAPVSTLGVAGAQLDATRGKWDFRAQFANSSPANPRSLFARDQYGNWAGGLGYTIRQGFRIGVSGYRGPYLDRHYAYFFPGEKPPNTLPARALGIDGAWAHGHSSVQTEVQKFVLPYTVIPNFREWASYAEFKQVLTPRWYVAARGCYTSGNLSSEVRSLEAAAGYRPNRFQLIKFSYEMVHHNTGIPHDDDTFGVQLVTTLHTSVAAR